LNPKIRIQNVNKRFYGQYYYKLEVQITGSGFLRNPEQTIEAQAESRLKINELRKVNFGGSWRYNRTNTPTVQDLELLNKVRLAQQKYPDLRIRVEEPMFQMYSETEKDLYKFAVDISYNDNQHLMCINQPMTAEHMNLLKQGYTISSKPADFPIKVHVREGRYSLETKSHILTYLQNMPDEVKLTKNFVESFSREYESVWNCYFYIKDRSILTMIALISPSLVRTTEEYYLSPKDK